MYHHRFPVKQIHNVLHVIIVRKHLCGFAIATFQLDVAILMGHEIVTRPNVTTLNGAHERGVPVMLQHERKQVRVVNSRGQNYTPEVVDGVDWSRWRCAY